MGPLVRTMLTCLALTPAAPVDPGGCGGGTVVTELPPHYELAGPVEAVLPTIDFSCTVDDDCEVKDVRNCCGYFPRCVNRDYQPDIDAVHRYCLENEVGSVCGYSVLDACQCTAGTCRSMQNGDEV